MDHNMSTEGLALTGKPDALHKNEARGVSISAPDPTDADMRKAYARAGLQHVGISFERAMETPHLRLAIKESALAHGRKQDAPAPLASHATAQSPSQKSTPAKQQCFLALQFQIQEDQ